MLCLANSPEMLNVKAPPPQKKKDRNKKYIKKDQQWETERLIQLHLTSCLWGLSR